MNGLREQYLVMRMKDGNGGSADPEPQRHSLRGYLYDKYVYRNGDKPNGAAAGTNGHEPDVNEAVFGDAVLRPQIRHTAS
jgi:hypothetical protein